MAYRRRYRPRYSKRRSYRSSRFVSKRRRSMRQMDTTRIIVSSPTNFITVKLDKANTPDGASGCATPVIVMDPFLDLVGTSDASPIPPNVSFASFAALFDQFHVNAMRIKVQFVTIPNLSSATVQCAVQIRSAMDRNGLAVAWNTMTEPNRSKTIQTYSSFNQQLFNINELYSLYKSFYPSTVTERAQWFGSSFKLSDKNHNPNIAVPFKPVVMLQLISSILPTGVIQDASYSVTVDYDISFKGQRRLPSTVSTFAA